MLFLLRYIPAQTNRPAVVLAAAPDRIRLAIAGHKDAVEVHRVDGRWVLESGSAVEIEAVLPLFGGTPAGLFRPHGSQTGRYLAARSIPVPGA